MANVLIINQYAVPPTHTGSTRHFSLARELAKQGMRCEIVCSNTAYRSGAVISEDDFSTAEYDGVQFTFLKPGTGSMARGRLGRLGSMVAFARVLRRYLRDREELPDIVVGSSPTLFAALVAQREAARRGVKFVLEVRDIWPQTIIDLGGYSRFNPVVIAMRWIERHLYRVADHIVTVLPTAHVHITDNGRKPEDVTWIPNGIDLVMEASGFDENQTHEADKFVVTYAGAHGTANALDAIVHAASILGKRHPDRFKFVFIGSGPEKEKLKGIAEANGIDDIEFLSPVPKEHIYSYLRRADALIVNMNPGGLYRYGISFQKIYDYLAAARPVVFGSAAINDPIKEAGAGISVKANDAAGLAEALEQLFAMPLEERREMGKRGRAFVERHHDMTKLAKQLGKVLSEVSRGSLKR